MSVELKPAQAAHVAAWREPSVHLQPLAQKPACDVLRSAPLSKRCLSFRFLWRALLLPPPRFVLACLRWSNDSALHVPYLLAQFFRAELSPGLSPQETLAQWP